MFRGVGKSFFCESEYLQKYVLAKDVPDVRLQLFASEKARKWNVVPTVGFRGVFATSEQSALPSQSNRVAHTVTLGAPLGDKKLRAARSCHVGPND
jgi:hypothetical protein